MPQAMDWQSAEWGHLARILWAALHSTRPPSSSQNRDRKGHISALTVQLTAQELEAEGAASVARNRVQPYVLRL